MGFHFGSGAGFELFSFQLEWIFIDGSYVKTHHHSAGAAGGYNENIGKSRADNTSKVHLAVNAYGLPEVFTVTGGHINDCTEAPTLMEKLALRRC
jgi:hypothetical protein